MPTLVLSLSIFGCAVMLGGQFGDTRRRLQKLDRRRPTRVRTPRRQRDPRSWRRSGQPATSAASVASAIDLLAACMSAGALLEQALDHVASACDEPLTSLLASVGSRLRMGASVQAAWADALADCALAPAARAVVRAHESGAPVADALCHVAFDLRRSVRSEAETAARKAGVRAVVPLGVCFLPAFVLVGVVPVVAGFAKALWS